MSEPLKYIQPGQDIWKKYNVPSPRYTSYPTVPFWEGTPSQEAWEKSCIEAIERSPDEGVSIYIHLPYCESLCTYCGCNKRITKNHLVEMPYLKAVLKEWELYKKALGDKILIRDLHFGGGTPTFFSPENLAYLMDHLLDGQRIADNAAFSFEAHPGNTTKKHLATLYKKGFKRLSLGIQDFNPYIQEVINRYQTLEQVQEVVDEARRIGYVSINFDLIYGLPFQTPDSVRESTVLALDMRPDRIAFYSYAHVPWKAKGQRKYDENDLPDDAAKRKLYEIGCEMFLESGYDEIGMDHFALPNDELLIALKAGKLHRNFMGYTEHKTSMMISLGTSSISDSIHAFVQNEKKVEDYIARVNEGIYPFFKGHLLNTEDLIIREHIGALMCNYITTWEAGSEDNAIMQEGIDMLGECLSDGLVEVTETSVRVTEKGKPFLRNIAMAFDARLRRKKPEVQVFSKSI